MCAFLGQFKSIVPEKNLRELMALSDVSDTGALQADDVEAYEGLVRYTRI